MPPSRLPRNPASSSSLPADVPSGGFLKTHPALHERTGCTRSLRSILSRRAVRIASGSAGRSANTIPEIANHGFPPSFKPKKRYSQRTSSRPSVRKPRSGENTSTLRSTVPMSIPCAPAFPATAPPTSPGTPAMPSSPDKPCFMHQTNRRGSFTPAPTRTSRNPPSSPITAGASSRPQRTSTTGSSPSAARIFVPPPSMATRPPIRSAASGSVSRSAALSNVASASARPPKCREVKEAMRGDATIRTIGFPLSRLFRRRTTLLNIIFYRELSPFT